VEVQWNGIVSAHLASQKYAARPVLFEQLCARPAGSPARAGVYSRVCHGDLGFGSESFKLEFGELPKPHHYGHTREGRQISKMNRRVWTIPEIF